MKDRPPRSRCPVSCTLEIIGDKWTLIVVRDLFAGASKFQDFLASLEGITTSVLAERLRRLERHGIVSKMPYQENPTRYEYSLTEMGKDLSPLMREIVAWANAHDSEVISRSAT
jgi:DNA-binding HxlR family transcriptional regulator